ncbi:MAG: hypothetical protein OSJ76_05090 [Alphaproteobacteria bacterium]|nr:hypothetical protein [Alphaproteobacteria bacterium]
MTVRNKFSPLGKPGIDSYPPETVLFENRPANEAKTQVELPILEGVYELMCCSGGGGQWCYLGCNQGAAGSFFKGVVYFPEAKTLQIQVGGGTSGYAHGGYDTYITDCIHCPGGRSANSSCPGNTAAPTLMDGMQVISAEINAGGKCHSGSLFPGTDYGSIRASGYMKLTYLRLEP